MQTADWQRTIVFRVQWDYYVTSRHVTSRTYLYGENNSPQSAFYTADRQQNTFYHKIYFSRVTFQYLHKSLEFQTKFCRVDKHAPWSLLAGTQDHI